MTTTRKTALVAGILYLITEVTAITAMLSYGSVLTDPTFIISTAVDNTGVARRGVPRGAARHRRRRLLRHPVPGHQDLRPRSRARLRRRSPDRGRHHPLRRHQPAHHRHAESSSATLPSRAAAAVTVGQSLVALHNWTFLFGPKLALGVNTVLLAFLMFRSQLVPRAIAILGLVGGSLVFLSGTAVLFGAYPDLSTIGVAAAMPVLAWELSLAVYMIIKGFRTVTPDEPHHRPSGRADSRLTLRRTDRQSDP